MSKKQKKKAKKIIISLILFIIGILIFTVYKSNISNIFKDCFFISIYIFIAKDSLIKAFKNIRQKAIFDENFLMSIATLGAIFLGEYLEAIAVILFYEIGEFFQSLALDKSRKSIAKVLDIRADYVNLINENNEVIKVDPDRVAVGDLIQLRPGEKLPLDSTIIKGSAMFDTSAITGESIPRSFSENDLVLSGFINTNSVLTLRVEKEFYDSTASKIIDMVENAATKKSKSERFITKFSKIYTPIVILAALLIAFLMPIFYGFDTYKIWIYRALTFLVVSCPCALVISIPLSFFTGLGSCSKNGILVKGANYLESLANTSYICFDKTGTLSKGVFELVKIDTYDYDKKEALKLANMAEFYSTHPIAVSIKEAYKKEYGNYEFDSNKISNFLELAGFGISLNIDKDTILLGNDKLMQKNNIDLSSLVWEEKNINIPATIVYLAKNSKLIARFFISDILKDDAKESIINLKNMGIKKIFMLSGDNENIVKEVSKFLSIDENFSELLPLEKLEKIEELILKKKKNEKLIFVGDGINDTLVLARADVGVAMGELASCAAIEVADVVIMNNEILTLNKAIKIAKRTINIAKQNIFISLFIKILVLILTAFGYSSMWMAIFADVGLTLLAIINSMRNLK